MPLLDPLKIAEDTDSDLRTVARVLHALSSGADPESLGTTPARRRILRALAQSGAIRAIASTPRILA